MDENTIYISREAMSTVGLPGDTSDNVFAPSAQYAYTVSATRAGKEYAMTSLPTAELAVGVGQNTLNALDVMSAADYDTMTEELGVGNTSHLPTISSPTAYPVVYTYDV